MHPSSNDEHPARRSSDNLAAPLTLQDGIGLFALRSELAAQGTLLTQTVAQTVPRAEQELRWKLGDERLDRIESEMRNDRKETAEKLASIDTKLDSSQERLDTKFGELRDEVRGARLPTWAIWVIGLMVAVVSPLLAVLLDHVLK